MCIKLVSGRCPILHSVYACMLRSLTKVKMKVIIKFTYVLLKLYKDTATHTVPSISNKKSKLASLRQLSLMLKVVESAISAV